jgi:hypothetical protein
MDELTEEGRQRFRRLLDLRTPLIAEARPMRRDRVRPSGAELYKGVHLAPGTVRIGWGASELLRSLAARGVFFIESIDAMEDSARGHGRVRVAHRSELTIDKDLERLSAGEIGFSVEDARPSWLISSRSSSSTNAGLTFSRAASV